MRIGRYYYKIFVLHVLRYNQNDKKNCSISYTCSMFNLSSIEENILCIYINAIVIMYSITL